MNRVSNIVSAADLALEDRREDIRDRRWRRRRDKVRTTVWVLAICCAALGLLHLLPIPIRLV
jgi:fatty acid desaturase